ncbi:hypothetical protein RCZ04_02580 [Capnocytophaga sp. HP1101]
MAKLRLSTEFFSDYKLIALHTHLEDYQLAYFLNKTLHLQLAKTRGKDCLTMPSGAQFSYYTWEDTSADVTWHCIANRLQDTFTDSVHMGLFDELPQVQYLVENEKKVDYFLKIDTEGRLDMSKILNSLREVPATTAREIAIDTIDKKYKLIFQEC